MDEFVLFVHTLSCFSLHVPASIPNLRVFEREGLQLNLSFVRPPGTPALLLITVTATNTSGADVTHFICQAAVPKVCGRPGLEVVWALEEKRLSRGDGWEEEREGSDMQGQVMGRGLETLGCGGVA